MNIVKYVIRYVFFVFHKLNLFRPSKRTKDTSNKILVQISSGIGDSILALPLIHQLKASGYEVHALVNRSTTSIARLCPDLSSIFVMHSDSFSIREMLQKVNQLRKQNYAVFIGAIPSNVIRTVFLPIILKIPVRVKHISPRTQTYQNYDFLYTRLIEIDDTVHNVDSNLELLPLIDNNQTTTEKRFDLRLSEPSKGEVTTKLRSWGYVDRKITVGMHPGCNESRPFKRWPIENFIELAAQFLNDERFQVLFFGGPDEQNLCETINNCNETKPVNLINKLELQETIYAIDLCSLFISNDSGLMHAAAALNIPVIGIFGCGSNEVKTGPVGESHLIMKKPDISATSVKDVYQSAMTILSDKYEVEALSESEI